MDTPSCMIHDQAWTACHVDHTSIMRLHRSHIDNASPAILYTSYDFVTADFGRQLSHCMTVVFRSQPVNHRYDGQLRQLTQPLYLFCYQCMSTNSLVRLIVTTVDPRQTYVASRKDNVAQHATSMLCIQLRRSMNVCVRRLNYIHCMCT